METYLAKQVRAKRLALNLSQKTVSDQSGVSLSVLKKFERTGKISLESLLKMALVLGCLEDFINLFKILPVDDFTSLDELLSDKTRKRGRQ